MMPQSLDSACCIDACLCNTGSGEGRCSRMWSLVSNSLFRWRSGAGTRLQPRTVTRRCYMCNEWLFEEHAFFFLSGAVNDGLRS